MRNKFTLIALLGTCLTLTGWLPAYPTVDAACVATLTEAHGQVYKRGFRDWQKEEWDDPQAATQGDRLQEGMQVGTGDRSWAELTWPNVSARAWANSVYAIAPGRRLVYLIGGEMLYHLNRKRKDKSPYYIWTKLLQARVRGTTVLVETTDHSSSITVLEGTIDVMNRLDHSVVRLKPGIVYRIAEKPASADKPEAAVPTQTPAPFIPISSSEADGAGLFETARTTSTLLPVDPKLILSNPLLSDPVPTTMPEIKTAMAKVTDLLALGSSRLLKTAAQIISVPLTVSYDLDRATALLLPLPTKAADFFPPAALTSKPEPRGFGALSSTLSAQHAFTINNLVSGQFAAGLPCGINPTSLTASQQVLSSGNTAAITQTMLGVPVVGGYAGGSLAGTSLTGSLSGALSGTIGSATSTAGSGVNLLTNLLNTLLH